MSQSAFVADFKCVAPGRHAALRCYRAFCQSVRCIFLFDGSEACVVFSNCLVLHLDVAHVSYFTLFFRTDHCC